MRVLVACEYSGAVRDAFIKAGHEAISCDLLPSDTPGPHYQGDAFDIINDGWDLMIARPGDYVIKGIQGELYACKPDIFKATYSKVEEDSK